MRLGDFPAVVILPDIFGWELPNTRKIADLLATNGIIAVLPDFFEGNSWVRSISFRIILYCSNDSDYDLLLSLLFS